MKCKEIRKNGDVLKLNNNITMTIHQNLAYRCQGFVFRSSLALTIMK